jgi:outer membrane protein insertion porin family
MIEPRRGYYMGLGTEIAGLGGDVQYMRNQLTLASYFLLWKEADVFLKLRGQYGLLTKFVKPVRIVDHFFKGGTDFRGFGDSGIGPRDGEDALGGNKFFTVKGEIYIPVGAPSMGLKTFLFTDWGSLWDSGLKSHAHVDRILSDGFYLRGSAGIGLRWRSPFGVIGVSFAKTLRYKKGVDQKRVFGFDFETDI